MVFESQRRHLPITLPVTLPISIPAFSISIPAFEDRVLPATLPVAAAWGRQYAQPLPVIDALVAATARVHGMTVVTRNVKDFELAGVEGSQSLR